MVEQMKMDIRYDLSLEDLIAYTKYYMSHSESVRFQISRSRWLISILAITAVLIISYLITNTIAAYTLLIAAIDGIVIFVIYPGLIRWKALRATRRLYDDGKNKTVFGWHTMRIEEDGFVEVTALTEVRVKWDAIETIETSLGYTFIFLGSAIAHVIPHAKVTEGDLTAFIEELGRRYWVHSKLSDRAALSSGQIG